MSASDFFGAYFPVFLFVVVAVGLAFALECLVSAAALVFSVLEQIDAMELRDQARLTTTPTAISGPPTAPEQSSVASRSPGATIGHGLVAQPNQVAANDPKRRCSFCDQVRSALFRARRGILKN